jgi:ribosomal protein L9
VNIDRHKAHYELIPTGQAVFITEEYLEMYKKDREQIATKAKVSPFAMQAKEEIEKLVLDIPMNMQHDWTLKPDNIRIALRYNVR